MCTGATRFTELDVHGIDVADLTDGCFAAEGDELELHRWEDEPVRTLFPLQEAELRYPRCGQAVRPCREAVRCSGSSCRRGCF